jgi:hypothetical protein
MHPPAATRQDAVRAKPGGAARSPRAAASGVEARAMTAEKVSSGYTRSRKQSSPGSPGCRVAAETVSGGRNWVGIIRSPMFISGCRPPPNREPMRCRGCSQVPGQRPGTAAAPIRPSGMLCAVGLVEAPFEHPYSAQTVRRGPATNPNSHLGCHLASESQRGWMASGSLSGTSCAPVSGGAICTF